MARAWFWRRPIRSRRDAQAVQNAVGDTAHVLDRVRRRIAGKRRPAAPVVSGTEASCEPMTPDEVFGLLRASPADTRALEEAAWLGRLDGLLPGFRSLLALRRPGLTHTLTVGAHSISCATLAATMCAGGDTAIGRSLEAVRDDRALLVAALAHDRGKSRPGPGHAERGGLTAAESGWLFGLDDQAQADVSDLVRLHLLLTDSATHDDLDSEDAILQVARKVGRRELLAPLHILAVADSLATGPNAWGAWQEALVGTLVSRVDAALSPEVDGAGIVRSAEGVRAGTLAILPADADQAALDFVARAPVRYLASRKPSDVAAHAQLAAAFSRDAGNRPARLAVRPGSLPGTFEVTVAARAGSSLFSRVTGVVTLCGFDILSAEAYRAPGRTALHVLVVRSATLAPVEHAAWQRMERYLEAALVDRLDIAARLAERGRHYDVGRVATETAVRVDTSAGYGTAIYVTAADRVGLLYDIACAIASEDLEINWAKALTNGDVARDTFLVVGPDGQAPTDAGVLGHVAMRIRERT